MKVPGTARTLLEQPHAVGDLALLADHVARQHVHGCQARRDEPLRVLVDAGDHLRGTARLNQAARSPNGLRPRPRTVAVALAPKVKP